MQNKFNLGFFPTPLEKLENLSSQFPDYNLFIKRDDHTGLATGGNKTRKLEYLIFDALEKGCDTVVTCGAQQSNHCRQTAAACAKAGLECHLLLGGQKPVKYSGNLLISKILGSKIHFTGENRKGEDIDPMMERLRKKGSIPYLIPYGGSNTLGAWGYFEAVKELKDQLNKLNLEIDHIFFATSSGGTQAGLLLGKEAFEMDFTINGINIDKAETEITLEKTILNIVDEFSHEKNCAFKRKTFEHPIIIRDYDHPGYGVVTENEKSAIKLLAETEGILLDPVYSGRAFFGMIDILKSGTLKKGSNILFWHTGGIPAIFEST